MSVAPQVCPVDPKGDISQGGDLARGTPRFQHCRGLSSCGGCHITVCLPCLNTASGWAISAIACSGLSALTMTMSAGRPGRQPRSGLVADRDHQRYRVPNPITPAPVPDQLFDAADADIGGAIG